MIQILVGAAVGLFIAAAGLLGYGLGLRHGAGEIRQHGMDAETVQQQDALMKKYEAILDYDPYGERV